MPAAPARSIAIAGLLVAASAASTGCAPDAMPSSPDFLREGSLADPGAIEGRYEMRIARMLDGTSRVSHHVKTADEVYEFVLDGPLGERPDYDSWVRVPGDLGLDGRWRGEELIVVAPPPQPLLDPEFREPRRIGTVLVFWEEGHGLPNGEAVQSLYSGKRSTNVYYGENSYGIETMSGKVFGPYQIEDPGSCAVNLIKSRAEEAMIERGHDPTQYDQMMFHFPGGQNCGFAGLASVGRPDNPARDSWYHGSFGCTTRNQELGHNYGMGHSHAYNCAFPPEGVDHIPYEECEHDEYGHPYDPMGNGCGHMNSVQKTYMGWLEGCNVVTATSDGLYNLMPIELPCEGTQALRIPMYDGRHYWVEYRNGTGLFLAGSGVLLNISDEPGIFGPANYVLDKLGNLENGYLREGDSFTDPGSETTITVVEEHETHVVIQVELPEGGDGQPPTCYGDDAPEPVMEGGAVGSMTCAAEPYPADDVKPQVTITSPQNGDVFEAGADFTIVAEASDDRQIIELELYLNGQPFEIKTEPPWEWPANDTPAGVYEFGVVARDARDWSPSQAVTVRVLEPEVEMLDSSTGEPTDTDTDTDSAGLDEGPVLLDDGCNCRQNSGSGSGGFALMLLSLTWLRRRRDSLGR